MRSIRRVLIVHPYGIGDLLFITPVLRALRLIPTVEKVDLLLGSRTKDMIETNPHVDDIFVIDKDRVHSQGFWQNMSEQKELGGKLKSNRYDLLIDYSLRREYAFWGKFLLGIPRRLGLDYKNRAVFHNVKLPIPEGFTEKHVTDYYAELVEKSGIPVEHRYLEYYVAPDVRTETENILKAEDIASDEPFMVVAPGGGESWGKDAQLKRWSTEYFSKFLQGLKEWVGDMKIVFIGSPAEEPLANELQQLVDIQTVNLAGKIKVTQAAAVLERAELFVGNDGGLVHIARALRKKLIAIYGPASPTVYGPYPADESALPIYKEDVTCRPCYSKFRYLPDCSAITETTPAFALEQVKKSKLFDQISKVKVT